MYIGILILIYICNDLLHASDKYVAIFREVKYKGLIHRKFRLNYCSEVSEPFQRYTEHIMYI